MTRSLFVLPLVLALGGCGDFPQAGQGATEQLTYPRILPITDLIGASPSQASSTEDDQDADLRARTETLQARADELRNADP